MTTSRATRRSISADEWNRRYPVGTPVRYTNGEGKAMDTKTRSHAWNLGHGDPVVLIEGCSGGRALWALEAK